MQLKKTKTGWSLRATPTNLRRILKLYQIDTQQIDDELMEEILEVLRVEFLLYMRNLYALLPLMVEEARHRLNKRTTIEEDVYPTDILLEDEK